MNINQFDTVSRLFRERRLSRREAVRAGAVAVAGTAVAASGLTPAVALDATPPAPATPGTDSSPARTPGTLFVQSFQSSAVTADPAVTGGYRVTLSGGFGQTIAFSDRPARDVAAIPQDRFLDILKFPDDNPPNAALLTDRGNGETDLAIVELRNPVVDEDAGTLTYDLQGLADWRSGLDDGLVEEASDLSDLPGRFGATHLFIDDCGDAGVRCSKTEQRQTNVGLFWETQFFAWTAPMGYCYSWADIMCQPCVPYYGKGSFGSTYDHWTQLCVAAFPEYCSANGGYCQAGDDYNARHLTVCSDPSGWCHDFDEAWI